MKEIRQLAYLENNLESLTIMSYIRHQKLKSIL